MDYLALPAYYAHTLDDQPDGLVKHGHESGGGVIVILEDHHIRGFFVHAHGRYGIALIHYAANYNLRSMHHGGVELAIQG
jgi:hypothetical protein